MQELGKSRNKVPHSVSLSQCLKAYPQFFTETKIALVQKFVGKLDRISRKYQNVDTLFLSNNVLTNIDGISQFPEIVHLTLANNNLDNLEGTISTLKQLKYLETLTVSGNPFCKQQFYRDYILKNLNLKQLEGKTITEIERQQSILKLKKIDGILQILLQNYTDLIRKDNLFKKLNCHYNFAEQFMDLKSFDIQVPNIETLLKLQPAPDINEQLMRSSLLEDIATISIEIKNQNPTLSEEKVYEQASSSLIIKQQSLIASFTQKIELMIQQMNQSRVKQQREREPEASAKKVISKSNGRGNSQKSKKDIDKPQRKLRFENQEPQIQSESLGTSLFQETKEQSRISIKQMPSALKNNRHIVSHCSSEKKRQRDSPSLSPQRDNVPLPIQIAPQPQPQKLNKVQSESIIQKPLIESETIYQKETESRILQQLQTQLEEQDAYIEQIEQLNIEQQHLISELQLKIKKYEKLEMINEKIKQENKEIINIDILDKQLRELVNQKKIIEYSIYEEKQSELLKVQKECDDKIAKLIIQKTKAEEQIKDRDNEITKQQKYIQELLEIVENQEHFHDELLKKEKQISDIYEQTQQQHRYLEKKDKEQEADHFLIKKLESEISSLRQVDKNFNDLKNEHIRLQEKCSLMQEQNLNFKEEIRKLTELYLNQKGLYEDLLLNQKTEIIMDKSDKKSFQRSNELQSQNLESMSQNYRSGQTQDSQAQRSHEKYDQQKEMLQKKFENLQYQLSGILQSKTNFYCDNDEMLSETQNVQQPLFESKFLKRPFSFQQNDFESKSLYGTPFHKQKSQNQMKGTAENYQGAYFQNDMNSGDENSMDMVRARRISGKIVSQSGNKPSPRVKTFSESLLKSAQDSSQVRKFLDQKIKNLQSSLGRDLEKARSTRLKF